MATVPTSLAEAAPGNGSSAGRSSISFGRGGAGKDMETQNLTHSRKAIFNIGQVMFVPRKPSTMSQ